MDIFEQTLEVLPGVGPQIAKRLHQCGISVCGDLCFHLPLRYENHSQIYPINAVPLNQLALIQATLIKMIPSRGRRKILKWVVADQSGQLDIIFFKPYQKLYEPVWLGQTFRFFGEVKGSVYHGQMTHPNIEWPKSGVLPALPDHYSPIYPTTPGLNQSLWRQLQQWTIGRLSQQLASEWPEALLTRFQVATLPAALQYIHFPSVQFSIEVLENRNHPAWRRLILEELTVFQHQIALSQQNQKKHMAVSLPVQGSLLTRFIEALPFQLTEAQNAVISEIQTDLQQKKPMLRLLQGDVGSGKTVVATITMLSAILAKGQAALMAPTEILAEQHYFTLARWLSPLGIRCALLTGQCSQKEKQQLLRQLIQGDIDIIIGTHALFQEAVKFQRLYVVIVDEQHRFGVHQRLSLWQKGNQTEYQAHQLIMTATPIPRTLAMSWYGMMDHSVIRSLPAGRQPIQTVVVSKQKLEDIYNKIHQIVKKGQQIYWICPLIDESEQINANAATAVYQTLQSVFPDYKIGLVHGRLKAEEKRAVFQAFSQNQMSILVATTVIEVGIDVPNATLMIIEDPERLGLAQLHQIRGRVGRGAASSICILLYDLPISEKAIQRLQAMRTHHSGFELADIDVKLRGSGELLGVRQTGLQRFRVVRFPDDNELLPVAQELAYELATHYPAILKAMLARWQPHTSIYAQV